MAFVTSSPNWSRVWCWACRFGSARPSRAFAGIALIIAGLNNERPLIIVGAVLIGVAVSSSRLGRAQERSPIPFAETVTLPLEVAVTRQDWT